MDQKNTHECITGQSKSGHCGAAAYCLEAYRCCIHCPLDCNIRCGWVVKTEDANSTT